MADIAQIGFAANTGELADAKTKMDALVPSAGRAERASQKLAKMFDGVNAAADKLMSAANGLSAAADKLAGASGRAANANDKKAQAVNRATTATTKSTKASDAAAAAANAEAAAISKVATANDKAAASKRRLSSVPSVGSNSSFYDTPASGGMGPWGMRGGAANDNVNQKIEQSAGAMKANVGNIAAQFQDIGVTAAMGMNPLLIALQQGTQLAMALGGGLRALMAAFAMVFGVTQLLTIAIVALVAAGIQMVNWTSLAQTGLNAVASILPQVAEGLALAGAALAIAFAPTLLVLFWNTFLTIAAGIVGLVGTIVATVGAIPLAIALILTSLYVFRDEWTQVLGFDLVGAVKTGVNYIIGAFVGAYNDIKFLWSNFADIIGAAAIGAANMAIRSVNSIISASVKGINVLISALDKIGGSWIAQKAGIGFEIGKLDETAGQFDEMANDAATRLEGAVKQRNTALKDALSEDYLGAMGEAIGDAATRAGAKIKEFSAGLGVDDPKKKKGGGGAGGASPAEKFSDIVNGAERTIASLQAERDAIGLSAEATARLKYETDLLNQAKQKNIDLTPQQREQLMALAGDMARLESETARAKEALDFTRDATKGFVSDLAGGLREGKSLWESFVNSALNLANKLIDRGLNAIIDKLFEVNSASSKIGGGAGGGGFLSGIVSFIGGLFNAKGNAFGSNGVQAFANGGTFTNSVVSKPTAFAFGKGGANLGIMGEAGPEAIMPLKRGPDGSLGVQMHNSGGTGQQISNRVDVNNTYRIEGAISEKRVVEQIRAAAEQTKEDVKQSTVGWLQEYQTNGVMGSN